MADQPAADQPTGDVSGFSLGRQIRLVRQRKALSIQTLAEAAGISRAWLGEIERGSASPSVDIVRRLADALGVAIGSLLNGRAGEEGPETGTEAATLSPEVCVIRKDKRLTVRLPSQPFSWELLTPLKGELQLMIAEMGPTDASMEMMEHGGQELVLVLAGDLEVRVADQSYDLRAGDAITFSARQAHGFRNRGPGTAKMLNATAPPSIGEPWH
jgi:transcriptional regulator with XRE-family HTH domain